MRLLPSPCLVLPDMSQLAPTWLCPASGQGWTNRAWKGGIGLCSSTLISQHVFMFFLGVGQLLLKFPPLSIQLSQTRIPSSAKAPSQGFSFVRAQSCRKCRALRCPTGSWVDSVISDNSWNEINSGVCAGLDKHLRNQREMPSEGGDWRGWRCCRPCSKGRKEEKGQKPHEWLSVPQLAWKNWGQNGDGESQISLTEEIHTAPKLL